MSNESVRVEHDGPVATIWLDRPDKRNAMNYEMWAALETACTELGVDGSVRFVVVRGAGGHFCAGADITELLVDRPRGSRSFAAVNMAAEDALATLPKPTVAYVDGDCIGGGCAIAIDCDLRIATSSARFGITPAKLGVVYPARSVERVARLLGPAAAKHLLFTGRLIDAEDALRIGLVDELAAGDGEAVLHRLCSEMTSRSLLTQSATKEMVGSVAATGAVAPSVERRWSDEADAAGDMAEGVAAFVDRRAPRFTWTGPVGR